MFCLKNVFNIETKEGNRVLERCRDYWDGLYQMRLQRRINRDFRNGIQWTASEKEAIKALGGEAIVQNICTIVSRNMVGQYRANNMSPIAIARKKGCNRRKWNVVFGFGESNKDK